MIPVLMKEMRTRMRGWRTPVVLVGYLCILGLIGYLVLQNNLSGSNFSAGVASQVGTSLFNSLAILQGVLLAFVVPATTATAISGERQRQTLDLLLVTRLSSLGITLGKLLAAVSFDLLLIVCSLPIFSLVFLFGGVGPDRVAELFLLFITGVLCLGSLGILISVLTRRVNASTLITYLLVMLLIPGIAMASVYIPSLGYALPTDSNGLPLIAYIDPGFGLAALLLRADGGTLVPVSFALWQANVIVSTAIAFGCIGLSTVLLRDHRA